MVTQLLLLIAATASTAVAATHLERVRARHRFAERDEERERERRRALRLVEQELYEAETWIERAARAGRYDPPARRSPTAAWNEHRPVLAGELGIADWHRVSAAYDAITDLNETLDARIGPALASNPENLGQAITGAFLELKLVEVYDADRLELRWRAIRTASWILRAYLDEAETVEHALAEDDRLATELWLTGGRTATAA